MRRYVLFVSLRKRLQPPYNRSVGAVRSIPWWRRSEFPTWCVAAVIYGGWMSLTYWWASVPAGALLLGGVLLAWHGSLQHETIHGHPTRNRTINAVVGGIPLSLWLPYGVYRRTHLAHHGASLTDPADDPESWYVGAEQWESFGTLRRGLWWSLQTLPGRLVLGPWVSAAMMVRSEMRRSRRRPHDRRSRRAWGGHLLGLVVVMGWLVGVCEIPVELYLLVMVYPGAMLTHLRSFVEHRPHEDMHQRSIVVDCCWFWSLLFLNNNLHAVHHRWPARAWFELPRLFRRQRERVLEANGGWYLPGYGKVALAVGLRPKDSPKYAPGG